MNVLVTGGTGFLGKHVVALLKKNKAVKNITVVSRKAKKSRDKELGHIKLDLSSAIDIKKTASQIAEFDQVIHLAGDYNFANPYSVAYMSNVVATSNLVDLIKETGKDIPLLYASTYAVKPHISDEIAEKDNNYLTNSYAITKAMSEDIVLNSGLKGACFRLGVLVGDSDGGTIEKIDGPYSFLKLFKKVSSISPLKRIPLILLPGDEKSLIPIVGVGDAASVFNAALSKSFDKMEVCSVFREDSPTNLELTKAMVKPYFPYAFIKFTGLVPSILLESQEIITGISKSSLDYLSYTKGLNCSNFKRLFPECHLKDHKQLSELILKGFEVYGEKLS